MSEEGRDHLMVVAKIELLMKAERGTEALRILSLAFARRRLFNLARRWAALRKPTSWTRFPQAPQINRLIWARPGRATVSRASPLGFAGPKGAQIAGPGDTTFVYLEAAAAAEKVIEVYEC